mmetsp:Transcript_3198/g.9262  ORF Transcript_3198/g.9262 Transcript_3198/m.9262 type:complete len:170 (+) Transcript_3198:246-755(+)
MAKAGDKRRLEEQSKRLRLLRLAIIAVAMVHLLMRLGLRRGSAAKRHWVAFLVTAIVELVCYRTLAAMAAPRYGPAGELISGGADIQVGGGYYFDAIYIAMIAQLGSIFTGYFWLVLLAVPLYCLWQIWVLFLQPYLASSSQPEPIENEAQRKKREKFERQQRRTQHYR